MNKQTNSQTPELILLAFNNNLFFV